MNRQDLRDRIRRNFIKRGTGYAHIQQSDIQKVVSEWERQIMVALSNGEEVMMRGFLNIDIKMHPGKRAPKGMNGMKNRQWMVKPGLRGYIHLAQVVQEIIRGDKTMEDLHSTKMKKRQQLAIQTRLKKIRKEAEGG